MSTKKKTEEELLQQSLTDGNVTDYAAMRDELLDELLTAEPFAFDLNTDALYRQYRDAYTRQGADAAGDAFGKASALTGGYANSYAQSVAAQTFNDYMLALQDKGLQLYENAYDRYRDEADRKAQLYEIADSLEREEYERAKENEQTEYERQQENAKISYDREQDTLSFAYKMAQLGDFSYLKKAGIDVSELEAAAKQEETQPEKISATIQNTAQETYYSYGYSALVYYLNLQIAYGQITEKGKQQVIQALTGR